MIAMEKIAIARLVFRAASGPRFVALLPQMEKLNDLNEQVCAPGFQMIFLPYCDDIRGLKFDPQGVADPELVLKAKHVVKVLSKPNLDSIHIINPGLAKHYRLLQESALATVADDFERDDTNDEPPWVDNTLPDAAGMQKYSYIIDKFNEAAFNGGLDRGGTKRKAAAGDDGDGEGTAKKAKKEPSADDAEALAEAVSAGTLNKCTVAQLKEYCKTHKLSLAGKKVSISLLCHVFCSVMLFAEWFSCCSSSKYLTGEKQNVCFCSLRLTSLNASKRMLLPRSRRRRLWLW